MIAFYGRTLKVVLRFQGLTLLVAVATLVLTIFLYIIIPKGFFPVQDTGVIQGISQAPASISFAAMTKAQQELAKVILQDPAVESISSFIGADGTNTTLNSGRMSINLKPLDQRDLSASDVVRRLNNSLAQVNGIRLFMQPVQNITVDDRVSRTQYQYTLEDPDVAELDTWASRFVDKLKQLPTLEDVATDQQTGGLTVSLAIDRVSASRLGIAPSTLDQTLYDAFGQRQINTMYTQLNQYHVILEAMPNFTHDPKQAEQDLHSGQCLVGRFGSGRQHFLLCFRLGHCRIQRHHHVRPLHSLLRSTHAAPERHRPRGQRYRRIELRQYHDQLQFQQRRPPGLVHKNGTGHRIVVDQSPGSIPFRDSFFQPGAQCLTRASYRRNQ